MTLCQMFSACPSIFKLDPLWRCIDVTSSVASSLFLVLLLGKALALGDTQIAVSTVGVVIRHVLVRGETWVDLQVFGDTTERLLVVFCALIRSVGGLGCRWLGTFTFER